jgi:hypothetical protein
VLTLSDDDDEDDDDGVPSQERGSVSGSVLSSRAEDGKDSDEGVGEEENPKRYVCQPSFALLVTWLMCKKGTDQIDSFFSKSCLKR